MQTALNRFIEMLKWPAALFMLVQSLSWFKFGQPKYLVMFAGFFIYFISRTMADASVKASMQIIAHELTHAFFAVLTLHKVKHIKAEGDDSDYNCALFFSSVRLFLYAGGSAVRTICKQFDYERIDGLFYRLSR